jgi:hypothetical protein
MAATSYWGTVTDPTTGKSFTDKAAYDTWAAAHPDQDAFAKQHWTGYNFSPGGYGAGVVTEYGLIPTGITGGGMYGFQSQDISQGTAYPLDARTGTFGGGKGATGQSGYIDPTTGTMWWTDPTSTTPMDIPGMTGQTGWSKSSYYYDQDYGLGPDFRGIIPIGTDKSGSPNAFYAGTPGGGGTVFKDLGSAQQSVAAYKTWYDSQYPAGTPGSQIAPTPAPTTPTSTTPTSTTPQTAGVLTTPGQAEQYFDSTKDFYTNGTPTATGAYKDKPTQPTNAEQTWNAYSGQYQTPNTDTSNYFGTVMAGYTPGTNQGDLYKSASQGYTPDFNGQTDAAKFFGQVSPGFTPDTDASRYYDQWKNAFDPAALKAMYDRQEAAAQNTLDRKSASAGWGDSGAAARATGNLSQQFEDDYLKSLGGWATTGAGLASAADASMNSKLGTYGGLASASDASRAAKTNSEVAKLNAFGGLAQGADSADLAKTLGYGTLASASDASKNTKATTGMSMASSADQAKNAQNKSWLDAVNTALAIDNGNLAKVSAGQSAANAAQNAGEGRLTGGFDRSLAVAQNMSQLTSLGLNSASAQTLSYNMADLQLQLSTGQMTYAQTEAKLKEYATAMGVTGTALTSLMTSWAKQNGQSDGGGYTPNITYGTNNTIGGS